MEQLYYGAAYYPELWDEETIVQDIREMKELGINCVRIGEFAWAKMEPQENKISLDFFKNILDRLYAAGISVIMCTPTPTPPIWVSHKHPERLYVNREGKKLIHGARQHVCTNNAYFQERARIIVEKIGQELGSHPAIIGWQIDNEFKCHVQECMCETCLGLWHAWLKEHYGTIEALNEAWGTEIWSQKYTSFDEIVQPFEATFLHNASLELNYRRFSYEKVAEFCDMQADILRKYSDKPITTNSNHYFAVDIERLFKHLDFAAMDDYPADYNYEEMLFNYDWMRKIKDKPFLVMETSPSNNGCLREIQKTHSDGFLTAEVLSAFASGANGFLYWLWRQQRTGCELPHGAILSSWGARNIGYRNVAAAKKELDRCTPLLQTSGVKSSEVAMYYSEEAKAVLKNEPITGYDYHKFIAEFHRRIKDIGYTVDFVRGCNDLSEYKVVCLPFAPFVAPEMLEKALRFAHEGGTLLIGPMTGYRTAEHTVPTNSGIGVLAEVLPLHIDGHYPLEGTGARGVYDGMECDLLGYSMLFDGEKEKITGKVVSGLSAGKGFVFEEEYGRGKIVFLGAWPDGENGTEVFQNLFQNVCKEAGAEKLPEVTKGTTVIPRRKENGETFYFAINMDGKGGTVTFSGTARDCLTGEEMGDCVKVEPYSYKIVEMI